MDTTHDESEHVILTFVGGDLDGRRLDSQSSCQPERTVVEMFLGGSNRGQQGCAVKSLVSYRTILEGGLDDALESQAATRIHDYQVIGRSSKDGICHLRVAHKMHDLLGGHHFNAARNTGRCSSHSFE
jgi:hypothetical protein